MKFFLILSAVASLTAAQQQCGCAPQPTIIQLSCGGSNNPQPPQQAPAPAPPQANPEYGPPQAAEEAYTSVAPEEYTPEDEMCAFDLFTGEPKSNPKGGWPKDLRFEDPICDDWTGHCEPVVTFNDPSIRRPPANWNGMISDLGFPITPGTAQYNMIACWPRPMGSAPANEPMQMGAGR